MWPWILIFIVGVALGYGVREIISRRRHKYFRERRVWDRRLEDRITPNEIDEDLAIAPEQKSELPAKADTKTTREDVDR
jgi:hypothetical protein